MKINFIKVNPNNIEHIRILYILLSKRKYNISHTNFPSYSEHKNFVLNSPYRFWYLLKKSDEFIGSIYITNENVIGLNAYKINLQDYETIFKSILIKHKPLKPIKSVRNANFLINVNPKNKKLIEYMEKFGMEHIQSSYLIKPITK